MMNCGRSGQGGPGELGFRGSEVEEVAVSEGRRQWLQFLGGMGFLVLWGLFWGFVLFGWLDGGVR